MQVCNRHITLSLFLKTSFLTYVLLPHPLRPTQHLAFFIGSTYLGYYTNFPEKRNTSWILEASIKVSFENDNLWWSQEIGDQQNKTQDSVRLYLLEELNLLRTGHRTLFIFFEPNYMQIIVCRETELRNFTSIFKFRESSWNNSMPSYQWSPLISNTLDCTWSAHLSRNEEKPSILHLNFFFSTFIKHPETKIQKSVRTWNNFIST
jgi:hypothetical protein